MISVARIEAGKQVLAITQNGYGKRTDVSEFRVQSRGGKGIMAMRLTDKTGLMAAQLSSARTRTSCSSPTTARSSACRSAISP